MKYTGSQWAVVGIGLLMAATIGCWRRDASNSTGPVAATGSAGVGGEVRGENEIRDGDLGAERERAVEKKLADLAPDLPEEQRKQLADIYGWTAVNIIEEFGPAGADAMSWLGLEGAALAREYPDTFKGVARYFDGETAVAFLLAVKPHLKELGGHGGLPKMVERINAMPPEAKALAKKYPAAIPFLVLAPDEVSAALRQYPEICLRVFPPVDLSVGPHGEKGAIGIAEVAKMVVDHGGARLRRWVEIVGLDGLLLAERFPEFFEDELPISLEVFLGILSANQDDIRHTLDADGRRDIDWALRAIAEQDDLLPRNLPENLRATQPTAGMWYNLAQHDPHTVSFLATFRQEAIRVINSSWGFYLKSGVSTPGLLMEGFPEDAARRHAMDAILDAAENGGEDLVISYLCFLMRFSKCKNAQNPYAIRVRRALGLYGKLVVPYLMEVLPSHGGCEGNAFINRLTMLEERGVDELKAWYMPPPAVLQAVPGYDAMHLDWVVSNGYTPTGQELLFGAIDGVFTLSDLVSLSGSAVLRKSFQVMGREALEKAVEAESRSLLRRLVSSVPKVAKQTPAEITKISDDVAKNAVRASRSAKAFNLTLRVINWAAKEWIVNYVAIEGLPRAVEVAVDADKSGWVAEKTLEVLKYMQDVP